MPKTLQEVIQSLPQKPARVLPKPSEDDEVDLDIDSYVGNFKWQVTLIHFDTGNKLIFDLETETDRTLDFLGTLEVWRERHNAHDYILEDVMLLDRSFTSEELQMAKHSQAEKIEDSEDVAAA